MIKVCPHCKCESLPRYKFCGECGTPLVSMSKGENIVLLMRETLDELSHNMSEPGGSYPIHYERNRRLVNKLDYLMDILNEEVRIEK